MSLESWEPSAEEIAVPGERSRVVRGSQEGLAYTRRSKARPVPGCAGNPTHGYTRGTGSFPRPGTAIML